MASVLKWILLLFVVGIGHVAAGHIPPDSRTLFARAPQPITKAIASASIAGTSARLSNGTGNSTLHISLSTSRSSLSIASQTLVNDTHLLDDYKAVASVTHYNYGLGVNLMKGLPDECLLWDDGCSGDRSLALNEFFNITNYGRMEGTAKNLTGDYCFMEYELCKDNLPGQAKVFDKVRSWMRSPQCVSSAVEYGDLAKIPAENVSAAIAASSGLPGSCCGSCRLVVSNVEIFYWPNPDANTSCLSIVGDAVNPLGLGATTMPDGGITYWGCTPKTPYTVTNAQAATGPPGAVTHVYSIITTAYLRTYGGIKFKAWEVNPWSSLECEDYHTVFTRLRRRDEPKSIELHPQSLVLRSITPEGGSPATTVVSGGFTFTSPSVYANFISVAAGDGCGSTSLASTMLSFAPGELYTIAGPIQHDNFESNQLASTPVPIWPSKAFDFGDLPCPPQSIMEQNWYKPERGEPYRPFIAFPQKLRDVLWFRNCEDSIFTAYDPPKTLLPAEIMAPTTTADPKVATQVPLPGPTQQDSGAPKTTVDPKPTMTPAQDPPSSQPKANKDSVLVAPDPEPTPKPAQFPQNSQPQANNDPAAVISDPASAAAPVPAPQNTQPKESNKPAPKTVNAGPGLGADPNAPVPKAQDPAQTQTQGGSAESSGQAADPASADPPKQAENAGDSFDPSNLKPDQMMKLTSMLGSSHTATPPSQAQSENIAPAAAPMQSQGLGAGTASAVAPVPMTPEQPNNSPDTNASGNRSPSNNAPVKEPQSNNVPADNSPGATSPGKSSPESTSPESTSPESQSAGNNAPGNYVPSNNAPESNDSANDSPGSTSQSNTEKIFPSNNSPVNHPPGNNSPGNIAPGNNSPGNSPSLGDPTAALRIPQVEPSVAVPSVVFGGQIIASSGSRVDGLRSHAANVPISIPPSQTAVVNGVVSQAVNNGVPVNGELVTPNPAPAVTAAVVAAIQSGFVGDVTTVNNEMIKSIAQNILTETTPSSAAAPIQLGSSAVVIMGASSVDLGPLVKTFGNQPVTADLKAIQSVAHTLAVGAPAVTIDGTAMSLGTAGILVANSETIAVQAPTAGLGGLIMDGFGQHVTTVGDQVVTANPTAVEIAGSTLTPGAPGVTVGGTAVSFNTAGDLMVGSQTAALRGASKVIASVATFAKGAISSAGSSPAAIDGTVIALASDAGGRLVNSQTVPLTTPNPTPTSIFSIAGQVFTAAPNGFAIGTHTLSPGGPAITISDTIVSLGSSQLQIGSSAMPLPTYLPLSVFTAGGQAFTAAPTGFVVDSQTLTSGGSAHTVSGTILSLGEGGVQIGTETIPLQTAGGASTTNNSSSTPQNSDGNGRTTSGTGSDVKTGASNHLDIATWRSIGTRLAVPFLVVLCI